MSAVQYSAVQHSTVQYSTVPEGSGGQKTGGPVVVVVVTDGTQRVGHLERGWLDT